MNLIKTAFLGTAIMLSSVNAFAVEQFSTIKVFKSASCGCCGGWIKHLEENGFKVEYQNVQDIHKYKQKANVPGKLQSCHTAFVDGYAIEGHVPAEDIKKMLTETPAIRGIAVPGMPMGSPGMDFGDQKQAYNTVSYTLNGKTAVYASH